MGDELLAKILVGLFIIILTHIILKELEQEKWFRFLIVFSMSAFQLALTVKYLIDLFNLKPIP